MSSENRRSAGFKDRTHVHDARARLLDVVEPHGRVETVSLERADERVLAQTVTSPRPAPHYSRAAMDGYAVRAADTFGASDRAPVALRVDDAGDDSVDDSVGDSVDESGSDSGENSGSGSGTASGSGSGTESGTRSGGQLRRGAAVRVHTGSELPAGADAVVMIEDVETVGDEIEIFDAVAEGENVAPVGEDVAEGQHLYDPGHRLRPSDLGLLKSVGFDAIDVYEQPRVSVVPTGDELVQADPDPGEVIETNGQTVTQLVARWGGRATYRDVVPDDPEALRNAFRRDVDHDLVVTTGGSSVGERDRLPETIADLGEVLVHGVALKPGHPVALGVIEDTPVLALPGYPVACMVNAVQFLRPALQRAVDAPCPSPPSRTATLERKVASEPGTRTFVRVRMGGRGDEPGDGPGDDGDHSRDGEDTPVAVPTRASGAGVLSSVALADGWVVVPEGREGYAAGTTVEVERWEWSS